MVRFLTIEWQRIILGEKQSKVMATKALGDVFRFDELQGTSIKNAYTNISIGKFIGLQRIDYKRIA